MNPKIRMQPKHGWRNLIGARVRSRTAPPNWKTGPWYAKGLRLVCAHVGLENQASFRGHSRVKRFGRLVRRAATWTRRSLLTRGFAQHRSDRQKSTHLADLARMEFAASHTSFRSFSFSFFDRIYNTASRHPGPGHRSWTPAAGLLAKENQPVAEGAGGRAPEMHPDIGWTLIDYS